MSDSVVVVKSQTKLEDDGAKVCVACDDYETLVLPDSERFAAKYAQEKFKMTDPVRYGTAFVRPANKEDNTDKRYVRIFKFVPKL